MLSDEVWKLIVCCGESGNFIYSVSFLLGKNGTIFVLYHI